MPPVQPREGLRKKVVRKEQAEMLGKSAQKAIVQGEIKRSTELSEKAVRLYEGLKKAGLLDKCFEDPERNPDYLDQSVSYGLEQTGTTWHHYKRDGAERKKPKKTPEIGLYVRVSTELPTGDIVALDEYEAFFNTWTTHKIKDTGATAQQGVSTISPFNSSVGRYTSHLPGVILEPQLRDLSDTLSLIEGQAVDMGMEPLK
jgi:hypothetical protein